MCRRATVSLLLAVFHTLLSGQTLDWRRVGSTVMESSLASPAGGPVERVWYSSDGSHLYAKLPSGRVWQTTDFETWRPANGVVAPEPVIGSTPPRLGRQSVVGQSLADFATSPRSSEEKVVATKSGVWRSLDDGASWIGLNEGLPNLPIDRILGISARELTVRVSIEGGEFLWTPGEGVAWHHAGDSVLVREFALRASAAAATDADVTAAAELYDVAYAGSVDGRLFFSRDRGANWSASGAVPGAGSVTRIVIDPKDVNFAFAVTQAKGRGRVIRTATGGVFWEDLTGNLIAAEVRGVAFDKTASAAYIATDKGVYFAFTDTPSPSWSLLRAGDVADVALDSEGNQLYAAIDRAGVFAALAPHHSRDPRVVSAADRIARAAAPGSLLSVLGARVQNARIGDRTAPVLAATDTESQIQVPFDITGSNVQVAAATTTGSRQLGLTVQPVSPSIFVDRDGVPLVLNGETGLVLDAATPARPRARLQVLMTGLGKVSPDWPTGLAAPIENAPRVAATVRAYLDREPVEVTRATLAPGYIGMYLVEIQLPSIFNRGTSELFIEAENQQSNRVRIFLEP